MVADQVEVVSRKAGETEGWRWVSPTARASSRWRRRNGEGRGTDIVLHIKKDADEFLERSRVSAIVAKYSDHIALPIVLLEGGKEETINQASALWTRAKSRDHRGAVQGILPPCRARLRRAVADAALARPRARSNIPACCSSPRRSRSTCSIRTASSREALREARLHHRPLRGAAAATICASCAAWSIPRTCRSTSAARCCSTTRCWPRSAQRRGEARAGRSREEGRGRGRRLRHVLGQFRRRAEGRALRGSRASRRAAEARALPLHPWRRRWSASPTMSAA